MIGMSVVRYLADGAQFGALSLRPYLGRAPPVGADEAREAHVSVLADLHCPGTSSSARTEVFLFYLCEYRMRVAI
jgi:hypothetical protein